MDRSKLICYQSIDSRGTEKAKMLSIETGHLLSPCVETQEIIVNEVGQEISCFKEI